MPGKIPRRPQGSSAEAEYHKMVYDSVVNESKLSIVSGQRTMNTTSGKSTIVTGGRGKRSSISVQTFKIRFAEDDYLVCREWDGTTLGTSDVYIAKPRLLRCSTASKTIYGEDVTYTYQPDTSEPYMAFGDGGTWEGEVEEDYDVGGALYQLRLNVIRTVVRDGVTEDQRVIEPWHKGEIIDAVEYDGGETTVGYITEAGQAIEYRIDGDSRTWARI
jgi:hypothetical protein